MDLDIEFLNSQNWDASMAERTRWLRENDPVHWSAKDGLWIVTKFEDVAAVSKDQDLFTSSLGVRPDNAHKLGLIDEGEPRHTQLRGLINKGFTPRMVKKLEVTFRRIVDECIDAIAGQGECDFVEAISVPLPLLLIAEMIGIHKEDRERFHQWSDRMIAADGNMSNPEIMAGAATAFLEYSTYVTDIIEDRRREPKDDLVSILVGARDRGVLGRTDREFNEALQDVVDEEEHRGLANDELIQMLVLLLVAGNETTRNGISAGMELLIENPEARQALIEDPSKIPAAVEEMLRLASPVHSFARTVMRDTVLRDKEIKQGDRVLMIYPSANHDADEFPDPERFDIDRNPHHVAFGLGKHFCLGANLARMEMRVAFAELLRRLPDIEYAGAGPIFQPSALVRTMTEMRVRYTPN